MSQKNAPRKRTQKREAIRRAKLRKRRIERAAYSVTGAVLIAAIAFFLMPFFQKGPASTAASDFVVSPEAAATLAPTALGATAPISTPAPTPSATPEITPEPTPEPTPYAFQTAGRKISSKKKMIALTFDDGPAGKTTSDLLDVLKKSKVKATFFMLGSRALDYPSLVERVRSEGHQIGTHTHDHKSLPKLDPDEMRAEVAKSIWAIHEAGGGTPTILRPPYGNTDEVVCEAIQMPMINWSVDTLDWESRSAKKVYQHLINNVKDGDIVLMHDLYATTITAVKKAIPVLKKKGYQFVTIDELFEARGETLKFGQVYRSCAQK